VSAPMIKVLLVDDDEDSFVITQDLLADIPGSAYRLEWVSTFEAAVERIGRAEHDVYLLDYNLGSRTGLDVIREVAKFGLSAPVVMLTGQNDRQIDKEVMRHGAADFLVKGEVTPQLLERSIRHALERFQANQEKDRLVAILEATPDFVGIADLNGQVTYLNRAARTMLGVSKEETVHEFNLANFQPRWLQNLMSREAVPAALRDGVWTGETCILNRSGCEVPLSQIILAHPGPRGKISFLSTVGRDISERKRTETSLLRLATAVEQTADIIAITDSSGAIQYVNPAFEKTTGYAAGEAIGRHFSLLTTGEEDEALYGQIWQEISGGRVWSGLVRNRRRDATLFETQTTVSPIRDDTGRINNHVIVARDVTYQRSIEEQLRHSQKMEAIGRLAGGVAHDFNNLLTVIRGYGTMLAAETADNPAIEEPLEEIQKATERASILTRRLLAFGRRQVIHSQVVDLNEIVSGMHQMLRRLISEDIEVQTFTDPALHRITCDPGQIEQVIASMSVNAGDAMSAGGTLTIRTANADLTEPLRAGGETLEPGAYVVLSITDTGTGIPEEVKAHLFEPFFTTKPTGKGTGLGLATAYGIVRQSGGTILVESEPGHGATFRIYLPAVREAATEPYADASEETATPCTATILVVEDEPALRKLNVHLLKHAGYRVLDTSDGLQALRLVRERPPAEVIDLVVTDVIMPHMDGVQMAREICALRPDTRILFISGYTSDYLETRGALNAGVSLLEKPFAPAALLQTVRKVLERPPVTIPAA
jgi:two-component system, cell cycle sensor histidine kinase and response regulator CckA